MKVTIGEYVDIYLRKQVLVHGNSTFARDEVRQALRKGGKFALQCLCTNYGDKCDYRQMGRKYKSGKVRVGCTLIQKKTVAIIRKWANAKQK